MSQMRAYLATPDDSTPRLTQRSIPVPGDGEILVRIHAAALNNGDLAPVKEATIPGWEFAGEVVALGSGAGGHRVGQRVIGIAAGAFAEYVTAHQRHVLSIPDGLDDVSATTLPTGLMTEYGAIQQAGLARGDSVLITAAASGIGLLGLQTARHAGARMVIGTTRNPVRRALLERAGADHVIVTRTEDLATATRELTDGSGVDVVLDHVGGDALDEAVQAARVGGSVVSVGRLAGGTARIDLFALARRRVLLQSVSYGPAPPAAMGDLLDQVATHLIPAVSDGTIRPLLDRVYPFDQLEDALARLRSGAAEGKIALSLA